MINNFFINTLFLLFVLLSPMTGEAQNSGLSERFTPLREDVYRVGILSFFHETCTYCPAPAGLDVWLVVGDPTDEILGRTRGYTGEFEARMEAYGGVELVGIKSPAGTPLGGSSLSWNTAEVWEYFTEMFIEDLQAKKPLTESISPCMVQWLLPV